MTKKKRTFEPSERMVLFAIAIIALALAFIAFLPRNTEPLKCINYQNSEPSRGFINPKYCALQLEVVATPNSMQKGLSGRSRLPLNRGMLFAGSTDEMCIWMKDMKFPIDIVWLNKLNTVISLKENVSPDTYPETYCVKDAAYVIEVNAFAARKFGLVVGGVIEL